MIYQDQIIWKNSGFIRIWCYYFKVSLTLCITLCIRINIINLQSTFLEVMERRHIACPDLRYRQWCGNTESWTGFRRWVSVTLDLGHPMGTTWFPILRPCLFVLQTSCLYIQIINENIIIAVNILIIIWKKSKFPLKILFNALKKMPLY